MRRNRSSSRSEVVVVLELTLMAFLVGFALAAPAMPARAATPHTIQMNDFNFSPQFLTINSGDTVQWHNAAGVDHTATSNTSAWTEIILSPGQTSSAITLSVPGVYDYICSIHYAAYGMWGKITVQSAVPEFSSSIVVVAGMLAMAIGLIAPRMARFHH